MVHVKRGKEGWDQPAETQAAGWYQSWQRSETFCQSQTQQRELSEEFERSITSVMTAIRREDAEKKNETGCKIKRVRDWVWCMRKTRQREIERSSWTLFGFGFANSESLSMVKALLFTPEREIASSNWKKNYILYHTGHIIIIMGLFKRQLRYRRERDKEVRVQEKQLFQRLHI